MWKRIDKKTRELFTSEDTVFHYTSVYTALEHILDKQELRLSPRKHSNDPIESINPRIDITLEHPKLSDDILTRFTKYIEHTEAADKLSLELINNSKQLCFCMNKSEEHLGFLKPRMWDQYADNYKGVSLAFSLKELKKIKGNGYNIINDPVAYDNYTAIKEKNKLAFDVDSPTLQNMKIYSEKIRHHTFLKHEDYIGESEYRFMASTKDEYNYINIEKALKGIVISENYTSKFTQESIERFAESYGLKILYISWQSDGIMLSDKEKHNEKLNQEENEMITGYMNGNI